MSRYRALSGRQYDLAVLAPEERAVLDDIRGLYAQRPSWDEFSTRWLEIARDRLWKRKKIPVGSPLYRIGQDLELRLGVAEGRVAPPDYRDMLADLIEDRFQSRYAFCKATGIDQGNLSRVLAGRNHLSPEALFRAFEALGVQVELVAREEVYANAANPFASDAPAERLGRLQRRIDALEDLAERAKRCRTEDRPGLLGGRELFPDVPEAIHTRLERGEDFDAALRQELDSALREQAAVARQLAKAADERRVKHARAAS